MNSTYKALYDGQVRAKLPRNYRGGFDAFRETLPEHAPLKKAAMEWAANWEPYQPTGLRLLGNVGSGKTMVGCAILKALIYRGIDGVKFANVADVFAEIKNAFNTRETSDYQIKQDLLNSDVLFLDDLGSESAREEASGFAEGFLYQLIEKISRDGTPTIIVSSNFSISELRAVYSGPNGQRFLSRVKSLTEPIGQFPNVDMREKQS